MNATAPTIRKSDATAASGTMSAPVTGRITLVLVAADGWKGTGAVEQAGAGSARCGTRGPGATVGSPVHVAVGAGAGVCLGAGVCVGVGVCAGVGAGAGVAARMHVHAGTGAGVVMHVPHVGMGVAWLMHWHVAVGAGALTQLQSGCIVPAMAAPGRMPPRTAPPGPPVLVAVVAASAIPPPQNPSTATASATTTEAAIDLTDSPVLLCTE